MLMEDDSATRRALNHSPSATHETQNILKFLESPKGNGRFLEPKKAKRGGTSAALDAVE
jgi:hypothetical protein